MLGHIANLKRFADEHNVILEPRGEIGFCRPCVGFVKGRSYIAHNPIHMGTYYPLPEFADDRLYAPDGVNAYHKDTFLAVLVEAEDWDNIPDTAYDVALQQLNEWVEHLESLGRVEIVPYSTGAIGLQAMISGAQGYVVRIASEQTQAASAGRGDTADS